MNKKNTILVIVVAAVVVVACVILAGKYLKPAGMVADNNGYGSGITVTTSTPSSTVSAPTSTTGSSTTPAVTMKTFSGSSYSFSYPATWSIGSIIPTSINNFNSAYQSGGVIPIGGAEIDVATTTIYGPLRDIMGTELSSASNVTTKTVAVLGTSCTESSYQDTYGTGGPASQNIALYCPRGTELWKLYLSYRAGDPQSVAHVTVFNNLLSSLKFLE